MIPYFASMRNWLLPVLLLASLQVTAQNFYFENISIEQGLPASKVYCVVQDARGLVWMGTEAGLANYDGNTVVALGENAGTAANGARSLLLDKDGRLWAGHIQGGISLMENGAFRKLSIAGTALTSDVTGIAQDADGAVWIATYGQGLFKVVSMAGDGVLTTEHFGSTQKISDNINMLTTLNDGTVCIIEDGGSPKRLDKAAKVFTSIQYSGLPELLSVTSLFEDSKGRLWFGTIQSGAYCVDPKTGQVNTYDLLSGMPSNFVVCFSEDEDGNIWAGTWDNGIGRIQPDGIQHFHSDNGLHSTVIRGIARDREGNMLIVTNDHGMDLYRGERFLTFNDEDGLLDPQVWAVLEDQDGRIWFGTNGGINILDQSNNSTARVKTLTAQQGDLTSNRVRCMRQDSKGHVWIGMETTGLIDLGPGYTMVEHDDLLAAIADGRVTALENGQPNELWIGTINGLVRYVNANIPNVFTENDGLPARNVTGLYRDTGGTVWVGTTKGLARVDNGKVTAVALEKQITPTCFTQDKQGRLWIGSEGQGIVVLQDGRFLTTYSTESGLLSNNIRSIMSDDEGHVWVGTNKGLNKWRPKVDDFLAFTARSGFVGIEAKPNAVCRTRNGDIWFGSARGATKIARTKGADKTVPPLVSIRGIKVDLVDRAVAPVITLAHDDKGLRIAYGSVSLSDPAAVRYQYILDGLEEDWQPLTYDADAYYPSLPAGDYTFKVKAMNRAGIWSDPPAELKIEVLPPWYRSWWFYSALILALGSGTYSFIKVRERQLRMRNQVLEMKVEERTAEVVAQNQEIGKQKVRIEDLLLNILPKEISEELKENGKATARRHNAVTVMFTDMKGFTRVAESMSPEELVNELDDCFIQFDAIIDKYGIEKIKTIGDSYMCAGGVPTHDPHHAHKVVLAGLEIRELMRVWAEERTAVGKQPWVLRIGLHTGPVVAGVVGKRKFAYDIWGDTVNTASRMESSGLPGEVNISGATYELVKDVVECEHRGKVEAKNKGTIDMYFVKRIKDQYSADSRGTLPNRAYRATLGLPQTEEQLA
ncbi:MAG: two-component regulator propeller domain-containing protein [Flavobacteriales bacterium]